MRTGNGEAGRPSKLWRALVALQMAMFVALFVLTANNLQALTARNALNMGLSCLGIFLSTLMYASILRSGSLQRINLLFLGLIALGSVYMFSDAVFWLIDGRPALYALNMADNTVYCLCPTCMTLVYWYFLGAWTGESTGLEARASKLMHVLVALTLLFILGNAFGGYYFRISPRTGLYERGAVYGIYVVLPLSMLLLCIVRVVRAKLPRAERWILLSYPLLPYVDALLTISHRDFAPLSVTVFCSITFMYTNIYVQREQMMAEYESALNKSRLLTLQNQINPHFIFNTLSSVASLCDSDASAAQEMVFRLADYLRDSYSDISKPELIPFGEELRHLEHYLSIETVRFPNIDVRYDIATKDFSLPKLTLQPLVENAIRHGIRKRRNGAGGITVATGETEEHWIVWVRDDGVGFDVHSLDGKGQHVGLDNVRTRLGLLCGGTLEVESHPGRGTTCVVRVPKLPGGGITNVRALC